MTWSRWRLPRARKRKREDALRELTVRYFTSHGPATEKDYSWWSGFPLGTVREGIELAGGELVREEDEAGTVWLSAPSPAPVPARPAGRALMLGTYEETTIAYKGVRVVPASPPPPDSGITRPLLLGDEMVGGWSRTLGASEVVVQVTLFKRLGRAGTTALNEEVARFGRFLELPARCETRVLAGGG